MRKILPSESLDVIKGNKNVDDDRSDCQWSVDDCQQLRKRVLQTEKINNEKFDRMEQVNYENNERFDRIEALLNTLKNEDGKKIVPEEEEMKSLLKKLQKTPEPEPTKTDVLIVLNEIYSYGMKLSLWASLWLFALGCLKFTKWDSKVGVPVLNEDVYYIQAHVLFYLSIFCTFLFTTASFWESGVCWKQEYKMFPYAFAGSTALLITYLTFGLGVGFVLVQSGLNLTYLCLTFWVMHGVPLTLAGLADAFTRSLIFNVLEGYRVNKARENHKTVRKRKSSIAKLLINEETFEKSRKKSLHVVLMQFINVLSILVTVSVILFIIPIVVADSTGDGTRIFILVVVLGFLNESLQFIVRVYLRFTDRVVISIQVMPFALEFTIQFIRRILLGCMQSPISTFIGLTLLSLEEAIMRGSLAERDMFFRKLVRSQALSPKLQQKARLGWAVSVVHSMTIEITAIISSKVAVVAFRPHIFIFNLGFQRPVPPSISELLAQTILELTIEVVVDFIALHKEMLKSKIPVDVNDAFNQSHLYLF